MRDVKRFSIACFDKKQVHVCSYMFHEAGYLTHSGPSQNHKGIITITARNNASKNTNKILHAIWHPAIMHGSEL